MRESVRSFRLRSLLPLAALLIAACSGGGGSRSPDLPFPELLSFTVACNPGGALEVGQTAQCGVTSCTYHEVLAGGAERNVTRTTNCPEPDWSTAAPAVATVDEDGEVTAVAPGNTTLTGTVDDVSTTIPVAVASIIFDSAVVVCSPNPINQGQTSQCSVNQCTGHIQGGPVGPRPCPTQVGWSASPTGPTAPGTINNSGLFTSANPGTSTITAQLGGISPTTTITVNPACVQSIVIAPATASVIAGQTQTYSATAIFTNSGTTGTTGSVTDSTVFTSDKPAVASFPVAPAQNRNVATTNSQLAAADSARITGTYSGNNICGGAASLTSTATLNVTVPQLQANGLCLELADGTAFDGCRPDTVPCATVPQQLLTVGSSRQLRLRGRYTNGLECNLTNSNGSAFTSTAPGIASVTTAVPRGQVSGLSQGTASIGASFQTAAGPVNATPISFRVNLDEVLGSNSVVVSGKPFVATQAPTKFACVGATDLVGGLADSTQLQGRLRVFAGARFCEEDQRDPVTRECLQFIDNPDLPPRDVTNDDLPGDGELANRIVWERGNSYWNGTQCVNTIPAAIPIGNGPPALVGDTRTTPANYVLGNRQPGENGVVVGAGNLRIGFACITATYHNPLSYADTDVDGMTVLVLPVTNDVLLGPSSALDSKQLCEALEPLFQLGASQNGGNGAVTQLLSAVTEIVNPILQSLAQGGEPGNAGPIPINTIVTQLLTALSDPVTSQLFATPLGDLVDALDDTVYGPVVCGLDTLLSALLGDPTAIPGALGGAQACIPTAPTFPFPFPAP